MGHLNKKTGIAVSAAGGTSSILGIVGTGCAAGCAGGSSLFLGAVTTTLGAGAAAFLNQYSSVFTALGAILLIVGTFLILKKRNQSCKVDPSNEPR